MTEPQGVADGEGDSEVDDELSDGEADELSSLLFFEGEGEASELEAFFLLDELEVLLVAPPAFLVLEVVDFLVVAAVEEACVVVEAVSSLCAHETTNAVPASTAVNPRTNFFIVTGIYRVRRLRLFNSLPNGKSFMQLSL